MDQTIGDINRLGADFLGGLGKFKTTFILALCDDVVALQRQ